MAKRNKTERPPAEAASGESAAATASPSTGGRAGSGFALPAAIAAPLRFLVARLSSVVLGVSLLGVVLVWVALGTFDVVLQAFDFTMMDWYVWWPFLCVLYLMCLNLTVVTFRRIPFNLPNLGVWVIHGSILLIGFGSTWFGFRWVDAVTRIDKGRTQSYCYDQTDHRVVFHVYRAGGRDPLAPHPDDGTGYSPNDLSEQVEIPVRLPQHVFRGGAWLSDKSIRGLREAGLPDELIARLNKFRAGGKRFAHTGEMLAKLAEALSADEIRRHKAAIETHASVDDDFRIGPIEVGGGLRLTIDRVWPYVDYLNSPEEADAGDGLHPAVLSALGNTRDIQQRTRLFMFADDPLSRRVELRGEEEMLVDFQRVLRPAYDARADVGATAEHNARWRQFFHGVLADAPIARLLTWHREPIELEAIRKVLEFFAIPPRLEGDARQQQAQFQALVAQLPFAPPRMVERVYILDPRLERPVPVFLEDWEARRELRLDAVGLAGERLVLEDVKRDPAGSAIIHYRAEAGGEVLHRLSKGSITLDLAKVRQLGLVGNPDAGAAQLEAAAVPVTARLNVVSVPYRTAAMQLITVAGGRTVELAVWSIEPGGFPRPARPAAGQFGVQFGRDYLPLVAYAYQNVAWKQTVTPVAVGSEKVNKALHVVAEYDYTDDAGAERTWRQAFWLPKIDLPDIRRFETPEALYRLNVPKLGPVELSFAGRRYPLGPDGRLKAKLEHFQVEYMPGGSGERAHREYSSFVTFTNPGDEPQTVKICMNAPKKADGWWFSQNSYDGRFQKWTVLSVAYKPMWSDPPLVPYAMVTLVCGVLWAFLVKPVILKVRRERNRQSAAVEGPSKA